MRRSAMIISQNGPQSVAQIQMYFRHGDLFLSPTEYQRESAWDIGQKRLLVDSIFRGFDIPKFYLWRISRFTLFNGYPEGDTKALYTGILERKGRENNDPDPFIYEVVDGQQRIRTILEYMGERPSNDSVYRGAWLEPFQALTDTPIAGERKYAQLNANQQITFGQRVLTVMVLEQATMDETRDMFLRLQNGTPLNAQQKRDALGSSVGRVARELATLPFSGHRFTLITPELSTTASSLKCCIWS
jgi:Protein of unknown function DUF262